MLFDPSARVITLVLHATSGLTSSILIDLFPDRITPTEGYTLDDAVLAVVGDAYQPLHAGWNIYNTTHWTQFGKDAEPFFHPVALLQPGAIAINAIPHSSPAPAYAHAVHIHDTTITIGDMAFPTDKFCGKTYTQQAHERADGALETCAKIAPFHYGLALGMLEQAAHTAPHAIPLIPAVCARFSPLAAEAGERSGRAARRHGLDICRNIVSAAQQAWYIRPAPANTPATMQASAAFARLCTHAPIPQSVEAGRALCDLVAHTPQHTAHIAAELAGLADTPSTNAHHALHVRALGKAIDRALIAHTPAAHLKTAAARKKRAAA